MTNARNTQALEDAGREVWAGITIYDVGDEAHAEGVSDHNHDDKVLPQGGRAEQSDSDSKPEVRALDFMLRGPFNHTQAMRLIDVLVKQCRNRIWYVIYAGHIWRRRNGFVREVYHGSNQHYDHVHVSTLAADDENGAPWTPVLALKSAPSKPATPTGGPDMIMVKAKNVSLVRTSDGGTISSPEVRDALLAKGVPLVELETTADVEALIPDRVVVQVPEVELDSVTVHAALRAAMADPTVVANLVKAINDDAAQRLES